MARILVIDDEHNIRMMIRLALQHDGHSVETAADGDEGLSKFGHGAAWDLVLLDQRMPGIDGITVLRQLHALNPNVRVIMITAFGTVDLAVDAMKAGATDFMRKPFTTDTLRGAVQTALSGQKEPPSKAVDTAVGGVTFGMTTMNGYRIEYQRVAAKLTMEKEGRLEFPFTVRSPQGDVEQCVVTLSPVVKELVKAHLDCDSVPGGERFWRALCEEALANHLYQNAEFPPQNKLTVDELTGGLRRFVDAITASA